MAIEIPEYEIISPGIYGNDTVLFDEEGSRSDVKNLILIGRFTCPTEDKVVKHLQRRIQEVEARFAGGVMGVNGNFELMIANLPEPVRDLVKNEDEETVKLIRANTPAPDIKEGEPLKEYVVFRYGWAHLDFLEKNEKAGNINNPFNWYNKMFDYEPVLESGFGEKWNVQLTLEEGNLPEESDIDVLIKRHSPVSDIFFITKRGDIYHNFPHGIVKEKVDLVYATLPTVEHVADLIDITDREYDEATQPSLLSLYAREHMENKKEKRDREKKETELLDTSSLPTFSWGSKKPGQA